MEIYTFIKVVDFGNYEQYQLGIVVILPIQSGYKLNLRFSFTTWLLGLDGSVWDKGWVSVKPVAKCTAETELKETEAQTKS
jgi:hypothetical protein